MLFDPILAVQKASLGIYFVERPSFFKVAHYDNFDKFITGDQFKEKINKMLYLDDHPFRVYQNEIANIIDQYYENYEPQSLDITVKEKDITIVVGSMMKVYDFGNEDTYLIEQRPDGMYMASFVVHQREPYWRPVSVERKISEDALKRLLIRAVYDYRKNQE